MSVLELPSMLVFECGSPAAQTVSEASSSESFSFSAAGDDTYLSEERLARLAEKYPPPAEWYTDDFNPFEED